MQHGVSAEGLMAGNVTEALLLLTKVPLPRQKRGVLLLQGPTLTPVAAYSLPHTPQSLNGWKGGPGSGALGQAGSLFLSGARALPVTDFQTRVGGSKIGSPPPCPPSCFHFADGCRPPWPSGASPSQSLHSPSFRFNP